MSETVVQRGLLSRDPEVLHGEPVFAGTRVPVVTLVDCLEDGYDLDEFFEHFADVRREQVTAAFELFRDALLTR